MLQAVMPSPRKVDFREVAVPEIKDGQVKIKIMRIGVCGSDIHVYHGLHPFTQYPVVQGHEISGEIVEIGTNVMGLQVGDKVTIQPQVVCNKCFQCREGNYHICDNLKVMGFQLPGLASEFVCIDSEKVIKLPDSLNFDEGAMVEPLAVGVHALRKACDIRGKRILVLGAGPIGNLIAQIAKGMGAQKVMITDISDFRLSIAQKCNIDSCINTSEIELEKAIIKEFGDNRADIILECVGKNSTINQAIENARKGTKIIVVGVFGEKTLIDLGLVQDRELNLIGALMYKKNDYMKAIELIKARKVNALPLITDHFDFNKYQAAYQYIDDKKDEVMKVLIKVSD